MEEDFEEMQVFHGLSNLSPDGGSFSGSRTWANVSLAEATLQMNQQREAQKNQWLESMQKFWKDEKIKENDQEIIHYLAQGIVKQQVQCYTQDPSFGEGREKLPKTISLDYSQVFFFTHQSVKKRGQSIIA